MKDIGELEMEDVLTASDCVPTGLLIILLIILLLKRHRSMKHIKENAARLQSYCFSIFMPVTII